jgi:hypothetical protein
MDPTVQGNILNYQEHGKGLDEHLQLMGQIMNVKWIQREKEQIGEIRYSHIQLVR